MEILSYVLKHDFGFAPNPFGGFLTLATCKPQIRLHARKGNFVAAIDVLGISWPTIYEPKQNQTADGIIQKLGIKRWPMLLLFDSNRKLISASPHLNMTSGSKGYALRSLDLTLTRVLGPLKWVPFISPVQ